MTTILAGDQFQIRQEVTAIKEKFRLRQPEAPIDFKSAASFSLDGLISEVSSQTLFHQSRLLVLSNLADWLDQAEASTNRADLIGQLCQPAAVDLVIVLAKPSSIKKSWLKSAEVDYRLFKSRTRPEIKQWIGSEFDNLGIKISPRAVSLLAELTNFQSELIQTEIDKMRCYDEIDSQLVRQLTTVSLRAQTFDLVENICRGRMKESLDIYSNQRELGEAPIKILGLINWQIRNLVLVKTDRKTPKQIAEELNLRSDYGLVKIQSLSRSLSRSQIQELIDCLRQTDYRLRCQFQDPDRCLEILILKSCYLIGRRF